MVSEPKAINELAPNGLVSMDMQDYMDLVADVRRLEWLAEHCGEVWKEGTAWRIQADPDIEVWSGNWRDAIDAAMRIEE